MATTLTIGNHLEDLAAAADWLAAQTAPLTLRPETQLALRLCLEEALANIVTHGFNDQAEHVIALHFAAGPTELSITIEDSGLPFDPVAAGCCADNSCVEQATIGGRGLSLIRSYADRLSYQRQSGRNIFTMGFSRLEA